MKALRKSIACALLLATLLTQACSDRLVDSTSTSGTVRLDLSRFAPKTEQGECVSIMETVVLTVASGDAEDQFDMELDPSDLQLVTFEDVPIPTNAILTADVFSTTGVLLLTDQVQYDGESSVTIVLSKVAPILWVCPGSLELDTQSAELSLLSRGVGATAWQALAPDQLGVFPAAGEIDEDNPGDVTVTRRSGESEELTIRFETEEGFLEVPVTTGTNMGPVLSADPPDPLTVLIQGVEQLDLDTYFSDPEDDELSYEAEVLERGIVDVNVDGSALTVTGLSGGTTTVTVHASDGINAPVDFTTTANVIGPDLAPQGVPGFEGPEAFCRRVNSSLEVVVLNSGTADTQQEFNVVVEFSNSDPESVRVDRRVNVADTVDVLVPIPPGCGSDCSFRIVVDADDEIPELDEKNNEAPGYCIG